ncbi:zinc knuckle CX2CX4HX4C containing protein [Tanacetum coccineum]
MGDKEGNAALGDRIKNIEGKGMRSGTLRTALRGMPLNQPGTYVTSADGSVRQVDSLSNPTSDGIRSCSDEIFGGATSGSQHGPINKNGNSFASVLQANTNKKIVKIKELRNEVVVEGAAVAIPFEAVQEVVVWFFHWKTKEGMNRVLEDGPWLIRTVPLILNVWSPNTDLKKAEVKKAPVWIKLHHVPIVAYSEIGLSLITTQLGKPITLDSYTSSMCLSSWGKSTYARALIEVSAEKDLLDSLVIAIPVDNGNEHTLATIDVEYEWNPPRCATCLVFDHHSDKCPKLPKAAPVENVEDDGFVEVKKKKHKSGNRQQKVAGVRLTKPQPKLHYRRVDKGESSLKAAMDTPINELNVSNSFSILETNDDEGFSNFSSKKLDEVLNPSDEEVDEELLIDRNGNVTSTVAGASTPVNAIIHENNLSSFSRVESHIKDSNLQRLCSLVFRHWDWTSNGAWCNKGTRIIMGWNRNDVDVVVIDQNDQVILAKSEVPRIVVEGWKSRCTMYGASVYLESETSRCETVCIKEFNQAVLLEERFLKQKAKIQWLKEGDSNSRYFYKSKSLWAFNSINLFKVCLNDQEALDMVREVTNKEIKDAMFSIGDDKSPGPDGFTAAFFKEAWSIIENDVSFAVREFFRNGTLLKELNHTIIALIPKGKRGLRQGDPLSPYLFTLVMEVLTLMLQRKVQLSDGFTYHRFCSKMELINLCFADDLFLFAYGDVESASVIKETLDELQNLLRDITLVCHGFERFIAQSKVAWEIVCLLKDEGGLAQGSEFLGLSAAWKYVMGLEENLKVAAFHSTIHCEYIGNGLNTSLWYDKWNDLDHIASIVSPHDIARAGLSLQAKLGDIRMRDSKVKWYSMVWFLSCIPRHAIHLWLIIRRKLKTQDLIPAWDVSANLGVVWTSVETVQNRMIIFFFLSARSLMAFRTESRLFQKGKRTIDQVADCIKSVVRLKLLSCKMRKSKSGERLARLWDLPEAIFV